MFSSGIIELNEMHLYYRILEPGSLMPYVIVFFVFNYLRWEVIVCFVEVRGDCLFCWGERWLFVLLRWEVIVCFVGISGIVDHHCLHYQLYKEYLVFCKSRSCKLYIQPIKPYYLKFKQVICYWITWSQVPTAYIITDVQYYLQSSANFPFSRGCNCLFLFIK
jgi:hypothetical protein